MERGYTLPMKMTADQSWRGDDRKTLRTLYRMKITAGQSRRGNNGKRLHTLYRMKMMGSQSWRRRWKEVTHLL